MMAQNIELVLTIRVRDTKLCAVQIARRERELGEMKAAYEDYMTHHAQDIK
jgi:hypothetical protein